MRLEDLKNGVRVTGIIPQQIVTIVNVQPYGTNSVEVIFKFEDGHVDSQLLYRDDESRLAPAETGSQWQVDADANLLRLTSEAYRIHLAHLFDPRLAVHTSLIEPLPHQITAVYSEMLSRQPLRFLLADDPGAGKTIMAGLLIKELIVRGDVRRCLICAPGSLTEQWQDELWRKFQLRFEILTRSRIDSSHSGNPFVDDDFLVVRIDQVARDEDLIERLKVSDWDLVVCDEAHKMSASFFGNELKETKRYKLGKLLSTVSRHFLLMTATPHNGKEEDFQLFMALLDQDRFEGRFRDGVHEVDTSDLMRRMVKERLRKFNGQPLFPERRAYTVDYQLSPEERHLYDAVTEYVREEFNRADQLQNGGRRGTVGFALTILQRRLASSPEAIYQSLHRRRKRLEKRLKEVRLVADNMVQHDFPEVDEDYWDDFSDHPDADFEELEIELVDSATAAQTIAELEAEIDTLKHLERQAAQVRRNGNDKKWEELAGLLQHDLMRTPGGELRKIVIFTEHRDTLDYLHQRLQTLLGRPEQIVTISGGTRRNDRLRIEDEFRNNPEVVVLLATDAAGEGINLQRAHLMVNYDLPWNPNRLEQRFGRIHRIGQEEVCHLWNLVAGETREGHVYQRLLTKLETERAALGGQVFDVLGNLFHNEPLRKLLVDAIRYGDRPDVRAKLEEAVDNATERQHVQRLFNEHSLVQDVMDDSELRQVRIEMERAAAQRLQPHYIKAFFMTAFEALGGTKLHEREKGRYQINHVPAVIRNHASTLDGRLRLPKKYERICFNKSRISVAGKPQATFICPGHLLLDTMIDLILNRQRSILKQGAILIDPTDPGDEPRALFYLEHTIRDASAKRHIISQAVRFVEIDMDGDIHAAGAAPYLDYRAPTNDELNLMHQRLELDTLFEGVEQYVLEFAVNELAPQHLQHIRQQREERIDKTLQAVQERLSKEIMYWAGRARALQGDVRAGKRNARLNLQRAEQRHDELRERRDRRIEELEQQRDVSASPPIIVGKALIVPLGMLLDQMPVDLAHRRITEAIAMQTVMEAEIAQGFDPTDVSADNKGYDIESRDGEHLRFLEVKGRRAGTDTITVTHNEMITGLNMGAQYALVAVEIEDGQAVGKPRYIWNPAFQEPNNTIENMTLRLDKLIAMSEENS